MRTDRCRARNSSTTKPMSSSLVRSSSMTIFVPSANIITVKGLTLQHKNYLDAIADVLTDVVECQKKISELKSLGVNVVYTYRHDAQADHSGCLKALADSNIYLLADLTSPEYRIWPGNTEWTLDLYKQYTSVVDALANFTNVLGFSVGLSSDLDADGKAQPFYKAAIRDIKRYIQDRKYRDIPVGLKAEIWMTFANNNTKLADYMSCESANPDFFGITFLQGREGGGAQCTSKEQINKMGELYKNASMPVFFSEYGCQPVDNSRFSAEIPRMQTDVAQQPKDNILTSPFQLSMTTRLPRACLAVSSTGTLTPSDPLNRSGVRIFINQWPTMLY